MGLQRKCFIASACTHGLLLALVFIGSAFISRKPPVEAPAFELVSIPATLVDEPNMIGGGNPNVKEAPQMPQQPPVAAPAQPEAIAPVQEPKAEPVKEAAKPPPKSEEVKPIEPKVEPKSDVKPEPKPKAIDPDAFNIEKAVKKTVPAKPEKAPSTFEFGKAEKKVIRGTKDGEKDSDGEERSRGAKDKQAAMAQARAGALSDSLSKLKGGLSSVGGSYEIPGPGGPAYASYYLALRKFYENAWIPPNASRGDEPVVEVEVVIARDGTILSQRITKKSGRRELDASVQNTLNRVQKARVPAFPSGSTDEKRTFRINFNLTDKLSVG